MKIFVDNLEFVGPHGYYERERREGRRFSVDLVVEIDDPESALLHDELGDTIDYRGLADALLEIGEGPSCELIERLGHKMLDNLFEKFPNIRRADLTLHKFATGVPGDPESVGIELTRQQD